MIAYELCDIYQHYYCHNNKSNKIIWLFHSVSCLVECEDTFKKFVDTGADGAVRAAGVIGFDDCSAFCLADPDCVAFDLDYACWIFTDTKADNTRQRQGINHYKRVKADPAECNGEDFQLNNLKFEMRCIPNTQYLYKGKLDLWNGYIPWQETLYYYSLYTIQLYRFEIGM